MDVKIQTPSWEIIDSGSIILAEEFVEFIIEGLTFRLIIYEGSEEGVEKTTPYVKSTVEEIDGTRIMMIRAFNYSSTELITMMKPLSMARIKDKSLFFRFASSFVKSEDETNNYLIHYCWYLAKS